MAKHNSITMSTVTASTSPHLTSRYLTDDEEPNDMVVLFITWSTEAINLFLEKWENTIFATPPPFNKPNNPEELQRKLLEHLTENIVDASVTSVSSVDCNAPASILLTAAISLLDRQQWIRNILDAHPAGWNHSLGAVLVPHNGKTVHVTLGESRIFK